MARARQIITAEEVVEINRRMLRASGGSFIPPSNFLNPGSLSYILGVLEQRLFGQEMYPSIQDKAAALGWHIIRNHVFTDTNKRTGIMACAMVLDWGGYPFLHGWLDADALETTLRVADGTCDLPAFTAWVVSRTT